MTATEEVSSTSPTVRAGGSDAAGVDMLDDARVASASADEAKIDASTHAGDAEQAILLAAAECFSERGFAATSVDEVARHMGYTKGRVYHYFRSKGELFIAAASYGLDRLLAEVTPVEAADGTAVDRLSRMARAHVLTQIRDLPFHRVMLQGVTMVVRGSTTPEERDMLERFVSRQRDYENIFRSVLAEGIAEGLIRTDNLTIATKTLLLALNGCCFWFTARADQGQAEHEALADTLVAQTLHGISVERP